MNVASGESGNHRGLPAAVHGWALVSFAVITVMLWGLFVYYENANVWSGFTESRELDVAGKFSTPDAWYQGHAIWHVLCALSLWLGWRYLAGPDDSTARWRRIDDSGTI